MFHINNSVTVYGWDQRVHYTHIGLEECDFFFHFFTIPTVCALWQITKGSGKRNLAYINGIEKLGFGKVPENIYKIYCAGS